MELTLADAQEYLKALGMGMPTPLLVPLLARINSVDECLAEAGYDNNAIVLMKLYLLSLFGVVQVYRAVTSERAPSGASRSYAFGTVGQGYKNYAALLGALDTAGCFGSLIPENPEAGHAAMYVGEGLYACLQ